MAESVLPEIVTEMGGMLPESITQALSVILFLGKVIFIIIILYLIFNLIIKILTARSVSSISKIERNVADINQKLASIEAILKNKKETYSEIESKDAKKK